jgi:hypothetical protein
MDQTTSVPQSSRRLQLNLKREKGKRPDRFVGVPFSLIHAGR